MQIYATFDANSNPIALTGLSDVELFWQQSASGGYVASSHFARLSHIASWDPEALTLNRIQEVTVADPSPGETLQGYTLSANAQGVITAAATFAAVPLADAQAQQLEAVQARKVAALAAMQYALNGTTYAVTLSPQDQLDVQIQLQLLAAEPAGTTISWEIVENVFLTWQLSDLQALQAAGVAHVKAVYANAAALVAQVNAATTAAACLAIDVTAGWPA